MTDCVQASSKPNRQLDISFVRYPVIAVKYFSFRIALVDHSGEAEKVGMEMPATKLLIFGNPTVGTPIMLAAPSIALDLPLRILVWEDSEGRVWTSYNSAAYLQARHGVPESLIQGLAVVDAIAAEAG